MIYVNIMFNGSKGVEIETKEFHNAKTALRFMYAMNGKGHIILGYSADDPYDSEFLNRRFKL